MEKKIFPDCSNIDVSIPIKLTVVIDENEIDNIEDTYAELAGNVETKDNCFQQIRNSLKRLKRQKSADKADYYYDSIAQRRKSEFGGDLFLAPAEKNGGRRHSA